MKKLMKKNVLLTILPLLFSLTACEWKNPNSFTEAEHIGRISERIEASYMQNDDFSDFTVHPLFTEADTLRYFVVEFAPQGFIYIRINNVGLFTAHRRMYSVENRAYLELVWKDEDEMEHSHSHYQVAEIQNEKRYLLRTSQERNGLIPAVKVSDKYINLVSMEEMEFDYDKADIPPTISDITFIANSYFDL